MGGTTCGGVGIVNLLTSGGADGGLKLVPGCTLAVWKVSSEAFAGGFFRDAAYHRSPRAIAVMETNTIATPAEGFERGRAIVSICRPSSSKSGGMGVEAPGKNSQRVFAGACRT